MAEITKAKMIVKAFEAGKKGVVEIGVDKPDRVGHDILEFAASRGVGMIIWNASTEQVVHKKQYDLFSKPQMMKAWMDRIKSMEPADVAFMGCRDTVAS